MKPLIETFIMKDSEVVALSKNYRIFLERRYTKDDSSEEYMTSNTPKKQEMIGSDNFVFEAIIQVANKKNKNNRIYDAKCLETAMQEYHDEYIQTGCAYCELDHPDIRVSPSGSVDDSFFVVKLKNACARIVSYRKEGDVYYGKIEILNTPSAEIIKSLILQKCPIGISVRGFGDSYIEKGTEWIKNYYSIICFDIVSNPSTHNAWLNPTRLTPLQHGYSESKHDSSKENRNIFYNKKEKEKVEKTIKEYLNSLR